MLLQIVKLWRKVTRLTPRDKIPPAPRGYANRYEIMPTDAGRVAARYGIRSPDALPAKLRKAGAASVDELVQQLEHHQPRAKVRARLVGVLRRLLGARQGHPHEQELRRYERQRARPKDAEIAARLNEVKKALKQGSK